MSGHFEPVVFLFDVDNTLIDSDAFKLDLCQRLQHDFGPAGLDDFWLLHAELKRVLGYADHLGTVQAFRAGREDDPRMLTLAQFLLDYPFAKRLFPKALQAIRHLGAFGQTVVFTEGDMVYQPLKVQRSGIWAAVAGRVMIPLDKVKSIDRLMRRYPAAHYVLMEDKPRLLAAIKPLMGSRLTTVFVRQGHYALDDAEQAIDPPPDLTIERIGDLIAFDRSHFTLRAS